MKKYEMSLRRVLPLVLANILVVFFCSIANAQQVLTKTSGGVSWQSVSTGTDDQNITGCWFNGTNLHIGIENGAGQTVNISGVKDGIGTDDQRITGSLSGNSLTIGIENGSSQTVTLPSFTGDGRGIYGGSGSLSGNRSVNLNGNSLSVLLNNSGEFVAQNLRVVNGRVPIGMSSTFFMLELGVDNAVKPSTSTWNITSDARLKNVIGEYSKGLREIIQLNPIKYHYKDAPGHKFNEETKKVLSIGLSAQEVRKVFPECVKEMEDSYLSLDIHSINVALVNSVQELYLEINQREIENQKLELELAKLKEMVSNF